MPLLRPSASSARTNSTRSLILRGFNAHSERVVEAGLVSNMLVLGEGEGKTTSSTPNAYVFELRIVEFGAGKKVVISMWTWCALSNVRPPP
jgi:hypothetical protein